MNAYKPDMIRILRPGVEGGTDNYFFMQDNAPWRAAKIVKEKV